jgi:hypothetical protein
MAKPGYKHLGEVPEEVFQKELFNYLKRKKENPDAKRVKAQFSYEGKNYTFQKSNSSSGYQIKRSSERVAKHAKRRGKARNQAIPLGEVEKMMVDNYYQEAQKRGLQVDHKIPISRGGPSNAPWNLGLMIPEENAAKADRIGGQYKYEPLEVTKGAVRFAKPASLAAAGIFALGPLGTAASAAETVERERIAQETQNPLDQFQAGLSKFSLGADIASYAPPAAIPATIASTGADVLNLIIDGGRVMLGNSNNPIRGRSGAKRAQNAL